MRLKDVTPQQWTTMTVNELHELTGRCKTAIRKAAALRGYRLIRSKRPPCKMINLYLPGHLIDIATDAAIAAGMSRSLYLSKILSAALANVEPTKNLDKSTKTGIPATDPTPAGRAAKPGNRAKSLDLSTKTADFASL